MTELTGNDIRVIIYGAGAIGGIVSGHLARTGYDVLLIGRPGHVNAIRESGLRLVTPNGTYTVQIPSATAPDQIDYRANDVVFLCVQSQNTEEALGDLRAVAAEDMPIFCLQNGVRNEEIAAGYFNRIYGVMLRAPSIFATNGEVIARADPPGRFIMGRYPSGKDDLVETIAAMLRSAGFLVLVTPDVMPYKWGKLMLNLASIINAITDASRKDNKRVDEASFEEAREILARAGIRWISEKEIEQEWPESAVESGKRLNIKMQGSTVRSLIQQQGSTETNFINGEIVRLAKQLGMQAPVNEALVRVSQEMAANRELPGRYTPAELCQMVGLD